MKKIFSIILMSASILSCSKFLEHEPYGMQEVKTEQDLQGMLDAFDKFTTVEGVTGRGIMWFENCSDNLVTGRPQAEAAQIKNFIMSATNGRDVKETWPKMYQLIAQANSVIVYAQGMNISREFKDRALGMAYFYRSFAYLWLCPYYGDNGPNGGLPIITENTKSTEADAPRPKSVLENYDMIIRDMEKAAELLPYFSTMEEKDYGLPHKAAAWAFAQRAALYAAQYDSKYYKDVIRLGDKVIGMTGRDKRELYPDYKTLFRPENNFSSEYIYSLLGNAVDGPKFHGMSFQNKGWGFYNTWGYFQPTLELYKAYEQGDVRRDATILYPGGRITFIGREIEYGNDVYSIASESGMTFRKWMAPFERADAAGNTVNSNSDNSSNILGTVLIRYADVLLMKAEALIWSEGEGNAEAIKLLNMIRKRAGLPENSKGTKAELKNERRCELAFEFQPSRHIDLVRWHDAKEVYAKPLHGITSEYDRATGRYTIVEKEIWPARNFNPEINHVFPIPDKEVKNSRNLKQNKGY